MIVIQSLEVFLTKKRLESQDSLHYILIQLEKKKKYYLRVNYGLDAKPNSYLAA